MGRILPNGKHSRHNPDVPEIGPRPAAAFTPFGQQSFTLPFHPEPNPIPPPVALDVRGKVGQTVFQKSIPPPWCTWYPRVTSLQRRRHVIPFDPRTMAQLKCRARWAAGVRAWADLDAVSKVMYTDHGAAMDAPLTGLQVFIREFCRLHSTDEYVTQALLWSAQPELPFLK